MSQQGRKLRDILPATQSQPPDNSSGSTNAAWELPPKKRKTSRVRISCRNCRTKKIACDNQYPRCTACRKRDEECVYPVDEPLSGANMTNEDAASVVRLLRTLPEDQAAELFRNLRTGSAVSANTSSAASSHGTPQGGGVALPPESRPLSPGDLAPPARSSLEFEVMIRHPIAYPTLLPVELAYMTLDELLNPRWSATPFGVVPPSPATAINNLRRYEATEQASTPAHRRTKQPYGQSPIAEEQEPYCDPRLANLTISRWTQVPITNDLAARIVSHYLETDHPLLGFFDADLFIRDLVSEGTYFCTGLLVNALLAWACLGYSVIDPDALVLSRTFFEVAKQQWEDERHTNQLTVAASAQFLSLTAASYGNDEEATGYLNDGISIGQRMGLFGVKSEADSATMWLDNHTDWIHAASQTAWGVFGWVVTHCLQFHVGKITDPPFLQIPGSANQPLRSYLGHAFPHFCRLWTIANSFMLEYYNGGLPAIDRASLEFAESALRELLAWADALPIELCRAGDIEHTTVLLHITFHTIVLDLMRPFLHDSNPDIRLSDFQSSQSSPEAMYLASVNQLKRLVVLCWNHFPRAAYSFLSHQSLLYLANAMLRDPSPQPGLRRTDSDAERRLYFHLCLSNYLQLCPIYRVTTTIVRGLLSMAVRKKIMTVEEALDFSRRLDESSRTHGISDHPKASLILDLDLAVTDPGAAQVDTLADTFDELTLFGEFTNVHKESDEDVQLDLSGTESIQGPQGQSGTGAVSGSGKGKESASRR
ncbi:hypothetical protein VTK73DRAFT_4318 [Phialemonium thermophilum]|uniref:Zn(2)-C6 fungal-type domain-containing protein n=1 Tax=Phialemonium thermophilum TaxID=223376 RepID=A0ABR3WTZ9_9PEZI